MKEKQIWISEMTSKIHIQQRPVTPYVALSMKKNNNKKWLEFPKLPAD